MGGWLSVVVASGGWVGGYSGLVYASVSSVDMTARECTEIQ